MKFLDFLFKLKTMKVVGLIAGVVVLINLFSNPSIREQVSAYNPLKDVNVSHYLQGLEKFDGLHISGLSLGQNDDMSGEITLNAKVVKVIDGDTIDVLDENNKTHRIRLYGIDAPEKKQSFGNKARGFLAGLISGKEVQVLVMGKDRYQRSLGLIKYEGKDINKEMVKNGFAWAYTKYSKDYILDQADAHAFKLGLWSEDNPKSPVEFRKEMKALKNKDVNQSESEG